VKKKRKRYFRQAGGTGPGKCPIKKKRTTKRKIHKKRSYSPTTGSARPKKIRHVKGGERKKRSSWESVAVYEDGMPEKMNGKGGTDRTPGTKETTGGGPNG